MSLSIVDGSDRFFNGNSDHKSAETVSPKFCAGNNKLENQLDEVVQHINEETEKPHNRTAIAVGTGVIGLSLLVTLFNPRISSKFIERLKILQTKMKSQVERTKGDVKAGKFYKFLSNSVEKLSKFISYTNNVNSVKDTYFKQFCTEEKAFLHTRNNAKRKFFKRCDKIIRGMLAAPHRAISRWGDSLAKHTVKHNYNLSSKKLNKFETLLKTYYDRLSPAEKSKFDEIMSRIASDRSVFAVQNLSKRFAEQEEMMSNLNNDIRRQWRNYKNGFTNKYVKTSEHFNKNFSFWAQDIMSSKRDIVNQNGKQSVDKLFNTVTDAKGGYNELIELLTPYLNEDETKILNKAAKKAENGLRKANKSECMDYFDKKRDLMLGSAPTDIVTAIVGLTTGAIALASADDKDKRISRLLTGIIPVIAGIGTNIALTTMLFSGSKGMLTGAAAGFTISQIGSGINNARLRSKGIDPKFENKKE